MKFKLLNLDRTNDRLVRFVSRHPSIDQVERVSAIDGSCADRSRLIANQVMTADLRYSDGALGCALSHLVQWRDTINDNEARTVIEDDAILAANFVPEVERIIGSLGNDWDYVMWGWNFDAWMGFDILPGLSPCYAVFDQTALREKAGGFAAQTVTTSLFPLLSAFGTICYSVSPRGAQKLLNYCMPLRPMQTAYPGYPQPLPNLGIDNMLASAWPKISAHVAVPPLVITENDHAASTVQVRPTPPPTVVRSMNKCRSEEPEVAPEIAPVSTSEIVPVYRDVEVLAARPASINRSASPRVPKLLHYVFGMMPDFGGKPWSLVHHACLASAVDKIKPDDVFFHFEHEPSGPWWELSRKLVTLKPMKAPTEIFGNPLVHVAQRAGVTRLRVLEEYGGIYLDADVMVHRSFDDLLHYPAVMGIEGCDPIQGMADAIIVAERQSTFVRKWLATYTTFRARGFDQYWAEHGVRMPTKIASENPDAIRILPHTSFFWPMWMPEHLDWIYESTRPIEPGAYVNHLWEAVAWKYFQGLTPGQVRSKPSNFHRWIEPYLADLPDDFGASAAARGDEMRAPRRIVAEGMVAR